MSAVLASWRSSPLTQLRTVSACGSGTSSAVVTHGPKGPKLSPPLARIHWGSARWQVARRDVVHHRVAEDVVERVARGRRRARGCR